MVGSPYPDSACTMTHLSDTHPFSKFLLSDLCILYLSHGHTIGPLELVPCSHISYRLLLTAVLQGTNQFCEDQVCHFWHETFHSACVLFSPNPFSSYSVLCLSSWCLFIIQSQAPLPSKGGTELPECRAMSDIQDKSAEDTQVQVWFLFSGFVWEKCLCLQEVALLGFVHWDAPRMTSVITLWAPSMFQAQCYSTA